MDKQGDSESTANTKPNEIYSVYILETINKGKLLPQKRIFNTTVYKISHAISEDIYSIWLGNNIKTINLE